MIFLFQQISFDHHQDCMFYLYFYLSDSENNSWIWEYSYDDEVAELRIDKQDTIRHVLRNLRPIIFIDFTLDLLIVRLF